MPSKSKAQQRFFGMVDAYKKGEMKNPSSKIKKAAKGMSMSDVKDFAETKHKGLPEKVEENMEKRIIRMTESDLHQLVKESVNKILTELDWKTYASAAEKQHDKNYKKIRGKYDTDRENRFKKAAADTFNRDYGVNTDPTDNLSPNQNSYHMLDKGWTRFNHYPQATFTTRTVGDVNDKGGYDDEYNTYMKEKGLGVTHDIDAGHGGMGKYHTSAYNPNFSNSINGDLKTAHERGNKEIDDYVNGKYNYQKGKGWTK